MSSNETVDWSKELSNLSDQTNPGNNINDPSYIHKLNNLSSKIPADIQFSQEDANNVCNLIVSLLNNSNQESEVYIKY